MRVVFFISALLACFVGLTQNKVVYIQNESIKVGLLPDVGGRMVYYAPLGSENVLLSDSVLWNEPESERIQPKADAPFKPYNGFITWVGPQKEWWNHQELNESRRGSIWPPDPWLIYGNFEITEQSNSAITIVGVESPVSGVKLTKKYKLEGNALLIEVTAENIRKEPVSWDLWSNARFDAFTNFYVLANEQNIQKIEAVDNFFQEKIAYKITDNKFTFVPQIPEGERKRRIAKAFIYPIEPELKVIKDDFVLSIKFEKLPKEQIHEDQALIELYNCVTRSGRDNVLELEHHGAFKTLMPGDEMTLTETWTVYQPQ